VGAACEGTVDAEFATAEAVDAAREALLRGALDIA
jgi:hypothetical protein